MTKVKKNRNGAGRAGSLLFLSLSFLLMSFLLQQKEQIKVYMVGDSTMSVKEVKAYPETGWGMPFAHFFDESVTIDNRAKNGRSTKTFISENRWQAVADNLEKGDYVFIQFGHNDEVKSKVGRYTTPEEYKANLTRFINETRNKGAKPVLLTPVARRKFDEEGQVQGTHAEYSTIVRSLASEEGVPLIDMDKKSQTLLQEWGPEKSKLLFMHLEPAEHPNYPEGEQDDTHFNELGARKMAQLVLKDLRAIAPELAERIVKQ
jgi:lysophospholipase L1-like esterase